MYCIDASVLTNSFIEGKEFHENSKRFLAKIKAANLLVILPEIVLPEVASAIARITGRDDYAIDFVNNLKLIPNFTLIPVDRTLAIIASEIAAKHKLRGCDAIYAAVALQFKSRLITLDNEQLERSKFIVEVFRPNDF